jgi:hypothetical protein
MLSIPWEAWPERVKADRVNTQHFLVLPIGESCLYRQCHGVRILEVNYLLTFFPKLRNKGHEADTNIRFDRNWMAADNNQ